MGNFDYWENEGMRYVTYSFYGSNLTWSFWMVPNA